MNAKKFTTAMMIIFFLGIAMQAYSLEISFDYNTIHMQSGSSAAATAHVENTSAGKVCFEIHSHTNDRYITAKSALGETCLNKNERTEFSIALSSKNETPRGTYNVEIELLQGNTVAATGTINLEIDKSGAIELGIPEGTAFCSEGFRKEISIDVINRENETQTVYLDAESMLFAPFFDESKVRIRGNSIESVKLILNTNETTKNGSYKIKLYARTSANYVEREILFRIKDCKQKDFEIRNIPISLEMRKGTSRTIRPTIENLTDEKITVSLSLDGNLATEHHPAEVSLYAKQSKTVEMTINAREKDAGGRHDMVFYAWTTSQEEQRKISVNVAKTHGLEIRVVDEKRVIGENAGIYAGDASNGIIEIEVKNTGDYNDTVYLSLGTFPSGTEGALSEEQFTLGKGKTRVIYATVHAAYDASAGEKTVRLTAEAAGNEVRKTLEFFVLEPLEEEASTGILQIASYPLEIAVERGGKAAVELSLYNDSDEEITVNISPSGNVLPMYAFFPQTTIPAKGTAKVSGKIVAGESINAGEYMFTLAAASRKYGDDKGITVKVTQPAQESQQTREETEEDSGILTGLFSLGALASGAGQSAMIIIIAIATISIVYLLLKSGNGKTRESK